MSDIFIFNNENQITIKPSSWDVSRSPAYLLHGFGAWKPQNTPFAFFVWVQACIVQGHRFPDQYPFVLYACSLPSNIPACMWKTVLKQPSATDHSCCASPDLSCNGGILRFFSGGVAAAAERRRAKSAGNGAGRGAPCFGRDLSFHPPFATAFWESLLWRRTAEQRCGHSRLWSSTWRVARMSVGRSRR